MRLRTKIFLLTAGVVALCLAISVLVVERQARSAMVRDAGADLDETLTAVDVLAAERKAQRERWVRVLTRFPTLRDALAASPEAEPLPDASAAPAVGDLERLLDEIYPGLEPLSLVAFLDARGRTVAAAGPLAGALGDGGAPPIEVQPLSILAGTTIGTPEVEHGLWRFGDDLVEVTAALVRATGGADGNVVGGVLVGLRLEDGLANRVRRLTDSHVIVLADDRLVASSLPRPELTRRALEAFPLLKTSLPPGEARRLSLGGDTYLARAARVPIDYGGLHCNHVILRSLEQPLAAMRRVRRNLVGVAALAFLAAFVAAWWGARRIADPFHRLAGTMDRIARSGKLESPPRGGRGGPETRLFRDAFRRMVDSIRESQRDRERGYIEAVGAVMTAVDHRDEESAGHAHRVGRYAVALARRLGLEGEELQALEWGALLHDVGKIAVPDAILRKSGPLTDDEWRVMRRHPEWGTEMLGDVGFLRPALEVVGSHHERWDGRGYPEGLAGERIPLAARIFAVVDTYDAITSDRHYRRAQGHRDARKELERVAGSQLDPRVVEAFLEISEQELRLLRRQADEAVRHRPDRSRPDRPAAWEPRRHSA